MKPMATGDEFWKVRLYFYSSYQTTASSTASTQSLNPSHLILYQRSQEIRKAYLAIDTNALSSFKAGFENFPGDVCKD